MATTKNQGTCAVCMRRQVVWDTSMVLHGYQRPGWGWITGDCFGTRRPAWEVSPEAAVEYVAMIRGLLANTETRRVIDGAPLPQLLSFTRDTAENGRVEGVNAPAAVARLRLHNALTSRPEAEQPATLLAGEWTRVTFVDVYYAEPRTVTILRHAARLSENSIHDRASRKRFWFDWITDVRLEA